MLVLRREEERRSYGGGKGAAGEMAEVGERDTSSRRLVFKSSGAGERAPGSTGRSLSGTSTSRKTSGGSGSGRKAPLQQQQQKEQEEEQSDIDHSDGGDDLEGLERRHRRLASRLDVIEGSLDALRDRVNWLA